jgi:protein-tyrosine-phosphatase
MAEAITKQLISEGKLSVKVFSAGTLAKTDHPITPVAGEVLDELLIPFDHKSKRLTLDKLRYVDVVFAMEEQHVLTAKRLIKEGGFNGSDHPKILLLDDSNEIDDPLGEGYDTYHQLAMKLKLLIPKRLSSIDGLSSANQTQTLT